MGFLVDASVLCEATRPRPATMVLAWLDRHDAALHVSTLTLAEILKGIHLLAYGRKRRVLENWFKELVASFAGRIVPFDEDACRTWGAFYAKPAAARRRLYHARCRGTLAHAGGFGKRPRRPPSRMDTGSAARAARLPFAFSERSHAGRRGLRLSFPRRHRAHTRAGDPLGGI